MIPKPTKKKITQYQKAKLGLIQMTLPAEKKKALDRDGHKCISCGATGNLDGHHIAFHNSERIYDETRNLYYRYAILCRSCHSTLPANKHLDEYCRLYVWGKHPDIYYASLPTKD